jgi:hypothetical protein
MKDLGLSADWCGVEDSRESEDEFESQVLQAVMFVLNT